MHHLLRLYETSVNGNVYDVFFLRCDHASRASSALCNFSFSDLNSSSSESDDSMTYVLFPYDEGIAISSHDVSHDDSVMVSRFPVLHVSYKSMAIAHVGGGGGT